MTDIPRDTTQRVAPELPVGFTAEKIEINIGAINNLITGGIPSDVVKGETLDRRTNGIPRPSASEIKSFFLSLVIVLVNPFFDFLIDEDKYTIGDQVITTRGIKMFFFAP